MVYDLIIIGSGPAGLAAAIYAARARLSFLVLEKMPLSGGQILKIGRASCRERVCVPV